MVRAIQASNFDIVDIQMGMAFTSRVLGAGPLGCPAEVFGVNGQVITALGVGHHA